MIDAKDLSEWNAFESELRSLKAKYANSQLLFRGQGNSCERGGKFKIKRHQERISRQSAQEFFRDVYGAPRPSAIC
jgi:hypothetical protein